VFTGPGDIAQFIIILSVSTSVMILTLIKLKGELEVGALIVGFAIGVLASNVVLNFWEYYSTGSVNWLQAILLVPIMSTIILIPPCFLVVLIYKIIIWIVRQ